MLTDVRFMLILVVYRTFAVSTCALWGLSPDGSGAPRTFGENTLVTHTLVLYGHCET